MPLNKALCPLVLPLAMLASEPARAADCTKPITASGRAAHPQNFDPPQSYDVETMATSRAVEAWRKAVAGSCPGHLARWSSAKMVEVQCEGYTGGMSCEVSGIPIRKAQR